MDRNALAYVLFRVLRYGPGGRPAFKANFYRSKNKRLHYAVGDGGTLWVVTGVPTRKGRNIYTLAYKLADCEIVPEDEVDMLPMAELGRYALRARDAEHTHHFSFKPTNLLDISSELLQLRFTTGGPISHTSRTAFRLRSFPVLTDESVELLKRLERKIRFGRKVLISYAREDRAMAERIQRELEAREISVWRDLTALRVGENWRQAVQDNLEIVDGLLVLLSPFSTASVHVQQEVRWALETLEKPGALRRIFPLLLPSLPDETVDWDVFKVKTSVQLRDLNARIYPSEPETDFFEQLALEIAELSSR